jgi:mRNA-degrading endonuclease RelE of RelBE toxin-antitoxin system
LIVIWAVEPDPRARREIGELRDPARREARHLLEDLHDFPLELADTILEGHEGLYAARSYRGRYRMLYRVSPKQRRVIVLRVRPRETAYEGL